MKSLWTDTASLPHFPKLTKNIKTDVLIIGGGMAGILTAYFLHQQGIKYVLVEKGRICGGTTQNTTAKITAQHGLLYHKLIKSAGQDMALAYLNANQMAVEKFASLCKSIDCDFERQNNYVYSTDRRKLESEMQALCRLGYKAKLCKSLPLPILSKGAVMFSNQAQFHPLKFVSEIAKDLNIYENTFVREMIKNTAITDSAKIVADKVIVTTHFPFINKHGSYFLKLYQHRSYILALENAPEIDGMYVDDAQNGMSFRSYKNLLLLGGGDHRTGKSGGNWITLRSFALKHYPQATEKYAWAAQDCMSLDDVPYIGKYSKHTHNMYVASGFNKWGMSGSMVSAILLSDAVMGIKNEFAEVFNPSRSILKPQLLVNGIESISGLLTLTPKRCPHLGCALKWNKAEHSWDCPCHGSRFDKNGKVLENPANGDLKR